MKAYEIINGMVETLDIFLESEQTEQDKENYEYIMEFLKEELETKSSNILKYIRNLELEVQLLKAESDRLEGLRKGKERKMGSLKEYMTGILRTLDKSKVETELGTYGLRKSTAVAIDDMNIIPKKFLVKKVEVSIDKRELAAQLKDGKKIKGVHLEERYSLQIK